MHKIKNLIMIVAAIAAATVAQAGNYSKEKASKNIVETAIAASFETLVAAVKAADLVSVLTGDGPFTVFAPTDEAFAALPEGTVESLLLPENKARLASIHLPCRSWKIKAKDVKSGPVATANGQVLDVKAKYGKVKVGGAKVVQADIMTSNGVIHVIDSVVLPPETVAAAQ